MKRISGIKGNPIFYNMLAVAIALLIPALFALIFLHDNETIKKIDISDMRQVDEGVEFGIQGKWVENSQIYVYGWAFNREPKLVDRKVLLQNVNDNSEVYELNTAMVPSEDLNTIYGGEDYDNCGFIANGKLKKNMQNESYEILILINDASENVVFHTGEIWNRGDGQ